MWVSVFHNMTYSCDGWVPTVARCCYWGIVFMTFLMCQVPVFFIGCFFNLFYFLCFYVLPFCTSNHPLRKKLNCKNLFILFSKIKKKKLKFKQEDNYHSNFLITPGLHLLITIQSTRGLCAQAFLSLCCHGAMTLYFTTSTSVKDSSTVPQKEASPEWMQTIVVDCFQSQQ